MLMVSWPCLTLSLCVILCLSCFTYADGVTAMSHFQTVHDIAFSASVPHADGVTAMSRSQDVCDIVLEQPCPALRQWVILVLSCFPMLMVSQPCPTLSLCVIWCSTCFSHADGVMAMSPSQTVFTHADSVTTMAHLKSSALCCQRSQ